MNTRHGYLCVYIHNIYIYIYLRIYIYTHIYTHICTHILIILQYTSFPMKTSIYWPLIPAPFSHEKTGAPVGTATAVASAVGARHHRAAWCYPAGKNGMENPSING